jgi:hypothetical protein
MTDGFDGSPSAELLPQTTNADVDDVRARIEVVPPDLGEQALATYDLARVLDEVMQQAELTVGQASDEPVEGCLPPRQVQRESPHRHNAFVRSRPARAQLDAQPRNELVESEGLREIVARSEPEPTQLRGQIRAGREDHDGKVGALLVELAEDREAVEARQEQIEDDRVVCPAQCIPEALRATLGTVDTEALGFQAACEKSSDSRLILDNQDLHLLAGATLTRMTCK